MPHIRRKMNNILDRLPKSPTNEMQNITTMFHSKVLLSPRVWKDMASGPCHPGKDSLETEWSGSVRSVTGIGVLITAWLIRQDVWANQQDQLPGQNCNFASSQQELLPTLPTMRMLSIEQLWAAWCEVPWMGCKLQNGKTGHISSNPPQVDEGSMKWRISYFAWPQPLGAFHQQYLQFLRRLVKWTRTPPSRKAVLQNQSMLIPNHSESYNWFKKTESFRITTKPSDM